MAELSCFISWFFSTQIPARSKALRGTHLVGAKCARRFVKAFESLILQHMRKLAHGANDRLPARRQLYSSQLIDAPLHQLGVVLFGRFEILFALGWDNTVCDLLVDVFASSYDIRVRVFGRRAGESLLFGRLRPVEQRLECKQTLLLNEPRA